MNIQVEDIDVDELGGGYGIIISLIGLTDTIKLSKILSGHALTLRTLKDNVYLYKEACKIVGEDKANKIADCFPVGSFYFPSIRSASKEYIKAKIKKEFNGYNYSQLATQYDYSERQIRRILSSK